jgi:hypothetical protein
MNIREFPLHVEEHHELVTLPARVHVRELLDDPAYPGVILGVETHSGPYIPAYELQQYFPNKPQVGETYEAVMTRPFLEEGSSYCTLEYKKIDSNKGENI